MSSTRSSYTHSLVDCDSAYEMDSLMEWSPAWVGRSAQVTPHLSRIYRCSTNTCLHATAPSRLACMFLNESAAVESAMWAGVLPAQGIAEDELEA